MAKQDGAPPHLFEKARSQYEVEHRVASRHGERVRTEGGAMRAGRHALAGLRGCEAGAKRKATPDCLGDAHHIGYNPGAFIGKERSGATDPCLHFVEHEEEVALISQVA